MVRLKGGYDDIIEQMDELKTENEEPPVWVEVIITKEWKPLAGDQIKQKAEKSGLKTFAIKRERSLQKRSSISPTQELDHFSPQEIFEKRLAIEPDIKSSKKKDLILAFNEIVHHVQEEM